MSRVITGHHTTGVKLTAPANNPVTVASGASVITTGRYAIYGDAATAWSLTNDGALQGGSYGVDLAGDGVITNAVGADISGRVGISITRTGSVTNHGTITGTNEAIRLVGGGSVNNTVRGAISAQNDAIVSYGSADIHNAGTIRSSHDAAIYLTSGTVYNAAGATLYGVYGSIGISQTGTVVNHGRCSGAVYLGSGTLTNSGYISSDYGGVGSVGVAIGGTGGGGLVENTGTIFGFLGGVYAGPGVDVINSGKISAEPGKQGAGVILSNGSSLDNSGIVLGGVGTSGGHVTNEAGASITGGTSYGYYSAVSVDDKGSVSNFGMIGGNARGVSIYHGGTVLNDASGVVSGRSYGFVFYDGYGTLTNHGTITGAVGVEDEGGTSIPGVTVTNAGTITGTGGTALQFLGSHDRLIVDPGAVFQGNAIGSTAGSILELASGSAVGVLRGLGTSFTNFDSIAVDPGARWSLAGHDTLENGTGLDVGAAATLAITGLVKTSGTVELDSRYGTISGHGTIGVDAHSVLIIDGNVKTHTLAFLAGGMETLALRAGTTPSSEIAGFGASAGNVIDLLGEVAKGLAYRPMNSTHGVLTISGSNGTLGTLRFMGGNYQTSQFHLAASGGNSVITFG